MMGPGQNGKKIRTETIHLELNQKITMVQLVILYTETPTLIFQNYTSSFLNAKRQI